MLDLKDHQQIWGLSLPWSFVTKAKLTAPQVLSDQPVSSRVNTAV